MPTPSGSTVGRRLERAPRCRLVQADASPARRLRRPHRTSGITHSCPTQLNPTLVHDIASAARRSRTTMSPSRSRRLAWAGPEALPSNTLLARRIQCIAATSCFSSPPTPPAPRPPHPPPRRAPGGGNDLGCVPLGRRIRTTCRHRRPSIRFRARVGTFGAAAGVRDCRRRSPSCFAGADVVAETWTGRTCSRLAAQKDS